MNGKTELRDDIDALRQRSAVVRAARRRRREATQALRGRLLRTTT